MANSNAEVNTKLKATDETGPAFTKAKTNLKEFGANLSDVGGKMSMMFTLPVVGGLALLNKHGADAAKTVGELKTALDDAIASNDPAKIAEAQAAWDKVPGSVRDAAKAYGDMQAAMAPVNTALDEAKTKMLVGLVPVVERLTPLLVTLAEKVTDAVTWFTKLPAPIQNTILGVVGFVAVAGPAIVVVGQLTTAIGSLQAILGTAGLATSLPTVIGFLKGVGLAAAPLVAPIAAFAAALLFCDAVVKNTVGSWGQAFHDAITAAQQLIVIIDNLMFGRAAAMRDLQIFGSINGGRAVGGPVMPFGNYIVGEKGPEILSMGANSGNVIPFVSGFGGGQGMAAAGSGGNITMINNFYGPPKQNAEEVERKIREMKRQGTL